MSEIPKPTYLEQMMTVPQFAESLGVTVACVRRWILERHIATIKLGRLVRIPASELARIIQAGLRPAKPRPRRGNR
jgi:excisionase family DNA binding protein